ncbi:T9SS type A sorting domain-containing protein [Phaeocystidibacter luteus]|uniref:T9SS type A sorting domain-containing protein n=1 Tax=Phaeocystidibacter luteus TaxID=911197 RepID=A0A6N6RGU9_9FLAO|nr:T9SS type A sorting domain-containing protein [Phaeocystidibacter luteus]KAB2813599.1 T9SS type A sorting domain-containing protein [Phaeocystidibacter luteus]
MRSHLFATLLFLCSTCSYAYTFWVDNYQDTGVGSLRYSINQSALGDTVALSTTLLDMGADTIFIDSLILVDHGFVLLGIPAPYQRIYVSGRGYNGILKRKLSAGLMGKFHFSDMHFIDCLKVGNHGGAIELYGLSSLEIVNCSFERCATSSAPGSGFHLGGAVECHQLDTVIITSSSFVDCKSESGGAVSCWPMYFVSITDCHFQSNSGRADGGALNAQLYAQIPGTRIVLKGCNFVGNDLNLNPTNTFNRNGGAAALYAKHVQIDSCVFQGNSGGLPGSNLAWSGGGALKLVGENCLVRNCEFKDNSARRGGAIVFQGVGHFLDLTFSGNQSESTGGAIDVRTTLQDTLTLERVTMIENYANYGGAIATTPPQQETVNLNLINCSILENTVKLSGSAGYFVRESNVNVISSIFTGDQYQITDFEIDSQASLQSKGYNVFSSSQVALSSTDIVVNSARRSSLGLSTLIPSQYFTRSMRPQPGSILIDSGNLNDVSRSQSGPISGTRDIGSAEGGYVQTDTIYACDTVTWWGDLYSTPGDYMKYLYNANGMDSIGVLTILPISDLTVSSQGGVLGPHGTSSTATYQWVDCDMQYAPIIGETNPTFTPTYNGSFALVLNDGGCIDTSDCILYQEVSLTELLTSEEFIYPIPSTGQFFISSEIEYSNYQIYSTSGSPIQSGSITDSQIDVSDEVANGIYVLELSEGDGRPQRFSIVISR